MQKKKKRKKDNQEASVEPTSRLSKLYREKKEISRERRLDLLLYYRINNGKLNCQMCDLQNHSDIASLVYAKRYASNNEKQKFLLILSLWKPVLVE